MLERNVIGTTFPPVQHEIEKGAIRRFAEALGETNPLYFDEKAAKVAGLRGLLAPPVFVSTLFGGAPIFEAMGADTSRMLVSEQSYELFAPIHAGDQVSVSSRLVDISEKRAMSEVTELAVIEEEGRNGAGELLFRARRTLVLPPAKRPDAPATI